MNPRRKKRLTLVLALVLGLGATIGLMLYALNQNMDLFYTPYRAGAGASLMAPSPKLGSVCELAVWLSKGRFSVIHSR